MITLKANKYCKACHGSGRVIDWVPAPFGVGNCQMPSDCDCAFEDLDEETFQAINDGTVEYEILPADEYCQREI